MSVYILMSWRINFFDYQFVEERTKILIRAKGFHVKSRVYRKLITLPVLLVFHDVGSGSTTNFLRNVS